MKKILSITISLMILLSFTTCAFATTENTDFCVKIVHTNDIHARVQEDARNQIIGMPKLKTIMDNFTNDSDIHLELDSGDIYHGQSIATLVQGTSIAKLINACGYDAMTVGNHDFNYGSSQLKTLESLSNCPILAGNVLKDDGTKFFDNEYYTKKLSKDGKELNIGVFGMIDPQIYNTTAPSNVQGLSFSDMKKYAQTAVSNLKSQGCNMIICLTHTCNPVALAKSIDGVDLWLAGHEHTDIDETVTTPNGNSCKVIENGYYLYEAGLIEIDCSVNENGNVDNLNYKTSKADYSSSVDITPNKDVETLLNDIIKEQEPILGQVVGSSPLDLDGVWEHLRIDETTLGRAITDSYLLETGADVAFENAGGIRASITKGDVTYGDIINVSPYGNYIVTKQVTGKQLINMLETSIDIQINSISANDSGIYDAWPQNSGSYLQVGGMTVNYDLNKAKGNRVLTVLVGNSKINEQQLYTVAINNYTAISDDYPELKNAKEIGEYSSCNEALTNYFKQKDTIIYDSVNKARMILSQAPVPTTEPETQVTTNSTTVPTQAVSTQTTTIVSTNDSVPNVDNNAVNTGSATMATIILLILLIGTAGVYVVFNKDKI